jgi:hypothetical protein
MPEHSEAVAVTAVEQAATEVKTQMAKANEQVTGFMFGVQKLMLEELIFAGNAFLERTQTEMHLFSELVTKMAGAHSVKDIRTMYEECGKHQLEFIRRDCNRVFRHGERMIGVASSLFNSHPLD